MGHMPDSWEDDLTPGPATEREYLDWLDQQALNGLAEGAPVVDLRLLGEPLY